MVPILLADPISLIQTMLFPFPAIPSSVPGIRFPASARTDHRPGQATRRKSRGGRLSTCATAPRFFGSPRRWPRIAVPDRITDDRKTPFLALETAPVRARPPHHLNRQQCLSFPTQRRSGLQAPTLLLRRPLYRSHPSLFKEPPRRPRRPRLPRWNTSHLSGNRACSCPLDLVAVGGRALTTHPGKMQLTLLVWKDQGPGV